ncbi:MAG: phosphoglycerate kinase [archaeon]
MKSIEGEDFSNKRVLIRVDFNVDLDENGSVIDDTRIKAAIPTIKELLKTCKQLIIMSHLGRPKGKVVPELRLDGVAIKLQRYLKDKLVKMNDCINQKLPEDKIILLENVQFHPGELTNDESYAKALAANGDVYVMDCFGQAHRNYASLVAIQKFLPSYVGPLVEKELKEFDFENMPRPIITVIGGAKLETKIPVIQNLLLKVDKILLGGAMVFTFYKAKGWPIGKSLFEQEYLMNAKMIMNNEKLVLPEDIVAAEEISEQAESKTVDADKIPDGWIGLDLGKQTITNFKKILGEAGTIIWNGPLGYNEIEKFSKASDEIAKYIADSKAKTIIGGGDTLVVIDKLGLKDQFDHVSTGGGASLVLLSGKELPAVKALG